DAVSRCLRAGMRTLVLGGGHETAFGHGAGVLDAFAQESVGIIDDAITILGQTSDHTLVDIEDCRQSLKVGDVVRFELDYTGLLM
ncbi:hypothetical protein MJM04_33250, partial [Salmonella enterica subsp. enterica serovar Cerro]|nr:hypothetical protein [Salmonella enterica subsp. enterica serovar Cerro]